MSANPGGTIQSTPGTVRPRETREIAVSLLTGGSDKPYVYGLTTALLAKGVTLDLIGSNELDDPDLRDRPGVNFFNFRGDQRSGASLKTKVSRIVGYYLKLLRYAATAKPKIFHILWNNKFETFDRTLLMLYYKALGKKIVLTAHNINIGTRDRKDGFLNRLTLRIQYRLADRIFVHTAKMKSELIEAFDVPEKQITIIPFGINNAVPHTDLTALEARQRLAIGDDQRTILFFGRIKPYKGLEHLITAFQEISKRCSDYRLMIVGSLDPLNGEPYNNTIREATGDNTPGGRILFRSEFVPDEEIEVYFKAADVLVLPYTHIYQSGVLVLGYTFGLPVLATDVGSLKEDVIEGKTGFMCSAEDPSDLTRAIERYFASDLFANLSDRRQEIQTFARERYSWDAVGEITSKSYATMLRLSPLDSDLKRDTSKASVDVKVSP